MKRVTWIAALMALAVFLGSLAPTAWAQGPEQAQGGSGDSRGYAVAAGFTNVLYLPGKVVLCTTTGALAAALTAVTLGTAYGQAARWVKVGCGGRWVVDAGDIRRAVEEEPRQRH